MSSESLVAEKDGESTKSRKVLIINKDPFGRLPDNVGKVFEFDDEGNPLPLFGELKDCPQNANVGNIPSGDLEGVIFDSSDTRTTKKSETFIVSKEEDDNNPGVFSSLRRRFFHTPYTARVVKDGEEIILSARNPGGLAKQILRHTSDNGKVVDWNLDDLSEHEITEFYEGVANS